MKRKPKTPMPPVLPEPPLVMFVSHHSQMPKAYRQRQEAMRSLQGLVGRNTRQGGKPPKPGSKR